MADASMTAPADAPQADCPWLLRAAEAGDRGYIMSTWRKTARTHLRWLRDVPDSVYDDRRHGYVRHVEAILDRCDSAAEKAARAIVACDPENPEILYGYAVAEGEAIHMVYVRGAFRRQGVARGMLEALGIRVPTVATIDVPRWVRERWAPDHDPFAAPLAGHLFQAWCLAWRTAFGEFRVVGVR